MRGNKSTAAFPMLAGTRRRDKPRPAFSVLLLRLLIELLEVLLCWPLSKHVADAGCRAFSRSIYAGRNRKVRFL